MGGWGAKASCARRGVSRRAGRSGGNHVRRGRRDQSFLLATQGIQACASPACQGRFCGARFASNSPRSGLCSAPARQDSPRSPPYASTESYACRKLWPCLPCRKVKRGRFSPRCRPSRMLAGSSRRPSPAQENEPLGRLVARDAGNPGVRGDLMGKGVSAGLASLRTVLETP
jgi:hypothetical protein